ncbi:MAG: CDP-alcohol phosphatidyltransferase family protein [SAR202 cluster bacterium]|nr:CDP-alcohol phosphatidyltransferase family protein [SAR202 cluster bacterium]
MAALGREQLRAALLRYVELPGARCLRALGLTPNAVTLLGFGVTVAASVLVGMGYMLAGGIVFLLGGGLDLLDGGLARLTGKASPFGALLDSVFDRLGEASLFVGLAVYALRAGFSPDYLIFFILTLLLALIFSQGVSYLRARGEGLGVFSKAGLMTRPERVALLGLGLIVGQVVWVLLAIAVISCFTLFQRMFTIRSALEKGG